MNRLFTYLCSALMLFALVSCGKKSEKLLLAGSGWNKIVIIDKETKQIEWEHPLEKGWECNSAFETPDGNILFSYKKGAKLITKDHQEIWKIEVPDTCEMQTARVLPDGNFLLGCAGHPAVIMEVNPKGEVLSRTEYETGIKGVHGQFRQINKNARGNYLLPLMGGNDVREVTPSGELVRKTPVKGNPFAVQLANNGNYWVACGDKHNLMEVNLDKGEAVRCFGENDIEGVRLFFVAGLYPSEKGLYVCNWQGHDKNAVEANSPQVFEMNDKGEVIWSLNDNEKFGMISTICSIR